jgi:hypothetical protein
VSWAATTEANKVIAVKAMASAVLFESFSGVNAVLRTANPEN